MPSTQKNVGPQTWMLRGFVGKHPLIHLKDETPTLLEATYSTVQGQIGFIVSLSFVGHIIKYLASSTMFLWYNSIYIHIYIHAYVEGYVAT